MQEVKLVADYMHVVGYNLLGPKTMSDVMSVAR